MGVRGNSVGGYLAVDDLRILPGSCAPSLYLVQFLCTYFLLAIHILSISALHFFSLLVFWHLPVVLHFFDFMVSISVNYIFLDFLIMFHLLFFVFLIKVYTFFMSFVKLFLL